MNTVWSFSWSIVLQPVQLALQPGLVGTSFLCGSFSKNFSYCLLNGYFILKRSDRDDIKHPRAFGYRCNIYGRYLLFCEFGSISVIRSGRLGWSVARRSCAVVTYIWPVYSTPKTSYKIGARSTRPAGWWPPPGGGQISPATCSCAANVTHVFHFLSFLFNQAYPFCWKGFPGSYGLC